MLKQEIAEHDYYDYYGGYPADHEPDVGGDPAWSAGFAVASKLVKEISSLYAPAGKQHHYQAAHGYEHIA